MAFEYNIMWHVFVKMQLCMWFFFFFLTPVCYWYDHIKTTYQDVKILKKVTMKWGNEIKQIKYWHCKAKEFKVNLDKG